MKHFWLFFLFVIPVTAAQKPLEQYIQMGLENNLALQQEDFSLQQAQAALREARGMFLPRISLNARYSRAKGGRKIDIPIGDLFNPVYSSLNALMGVQAFPTDLENRSIPFLREREHDTKIRVTQPVFEPRIYFNAKIKKELSRIESSSKQAFARELIAEIKQAFFNYLKTENLLDLLSETGLLLQENLDVSQSLYENDKVTQANVYRAEAELAEWEQSLAQAEKHNDAARSYFNFLLNRELDAPIERQSFQDSTFVLPPLQETIDAALSNRQELFQLRRSIDIAGHQVRLHRSSFLPSVSVAADYGFQGKEYSFTEKDDYWMASAVASWNLFNGFQDKNQIQMAKLEKRRQQLKLEQVKNQLRMDVRSKHYAVQVAERSKEAARKKRRSAQKAFEIIKQRYNEGIVPHIEFIDSRHMLTQAEINDLNATYDYWIHVAQLEKTMGIRGE